MTHSTSLGSTRLTMLRTMLSEVEAQGHPEQATNEMRSASKDEKSL